MKLSTSISISHLIARVYIPAADQQSSDIKPTPREQRQQRTPISLPALTATTTTASPETCLHFKLPIFGALPFGSERTLTLGLREADLLLLLLLSRALSSAELAFRLCGTARTLLKQRSFRVFPPAQVFDFQPCRTNSSIVRWIKRG